MGFKQQLIAEVRRRPAIWNNKCEEYKNRQLTDRQWDDIAKKLGKSKSYIKMKWRNLRDVFRRELRRVRLRGAGGAAAGGAGLARELYYGGKWMFFKHMSFLDDAGALAAGGGAGGGEGEAEAWALHVQTKQEASSDESTYDLEPPAECPPPAEPPRPEPSRAEPADADSADLMFFKSLLPFLEFLGPVQRLRLRSRIQDLVAAELAGGGGGGPPVRGPALN